MTELLRGLPPGASLGAALVALIVYWASTEIGERRAMRLFQQSCLTSLTAATDRARSEADFEAAIKRKLIDMIERTCGPLCRLIDRDRSLGTVGGLNGKEIQANRAQDLRSAEGRCRCAIDKAVRQDTWLAHVIYVGSLRLIEPVAIKTLPASIAGALGSGRCFAGGRS